MMDPDLMLLSRAAVYALGAADTVRPELWVRPTPCSEWDLQMLLRHVCESVAALQEGLATGRVALFSHPDDYLPADLAELFRTRLSMLVDEWPGSDPSRIVAIGDHTVTVSDMVGAAGLEIAVHGWDIAQASGHPRPIPSDLAGDLLPVATQFLADGNRHPLFAPAIPLAESACSGDELLAFLGRRSSAISRGYHPPERSIRR